MSHSNDGPDRHQDRRQEGRQRENRENHEHRDHGTSALIREYLGEAGIHFGRHKNNGGERNQPAEQNKSRNGTTPESLGMASAKELLGPNANGKLKEANAGSTSGPKDGNTPGHPDVNRANKADKLPHVEITSHPQVEAGRQPAVGTDKSAGSERSGVGSIGQQIEAQIAAAKLKSAQPSPDGTTGGGSIGQQIEAQIAAAKLKSPQAAGTALEGTPTAEPKSDTPQRTGVEGITSQIQAQIAASIMKPQGSERPSDIGAGSTGLRPSETRYFPDAQRTGAGAIAQQIDEKIAASLKPREAAKGAADTNIAATAPSARPENNIAATPAARLENSTATAPSANPENSIATAPAARPENKIATAPSANPETNLAASTSESKLAPSVPPSPEPKLAPTSAPADTKLAAASLPAPDAKLAASTAPQPRQEAAPVQQAADAPPKAAEQPAQLAPDKDELNYPEPKEPGTIDTIRAFAAAGIAFPKGLIVTAKSAVDHFGPEQKANLTKYFVPLGPKLGDVASTLGGLGEDKLKGVLGQMGNMDKTQMKDLAHWLGDKDQLPKVSDALNSMSADQIKNSSTQEFFGTLYNSVIPRKAEVANATQPDRTTSERPPAPQAIDTLAKPLAANSTESSQPPTSATNARPFAALDAKKEIPPVAATTNGETPDATPGIKKETIATTGEAPGVAPVLKKETSPAAEDDKAPAAPEVRPAVQTQIASSDKPAAGSDPAKLQPAKPAAPLEQTKPTVADKRPEQTKPTVAEQLPAPPKPATGMDDPRVAALIDKGMQRNPQAVQDAMAEIGKLSDKQLAALTAGKQADTSGLDKMNQGDFDNLLKASPNLIKAVEKLTPEEITKLKGIADSQKPGKHDDAQSSQMLNMLSHMPPDKIASAAKMFASFSPGDMHMMMNLGDRFGGGKGKQNPQMMNSFLNQMESLSPRQRHTVLSTLNAFSAGEMNKLRRLSGGGGSMDLHQVLEIAPYTKYIKMGLGFM